MAEKSNLKYNVGDILADRYQVLSSLGSGGMASVWKARDLKTNAEVAVKVTPVPSDKTQRQKTISRYRNELNAFATLTQNRHVVKLYDMVEQNGILFIVMEAVEGGTLTHRFREFYDMTLDELKFYFSRLCSALESAESFHIIHRDIKPDNILIGLDGQVKLGDFGIAILSDDDLEATTVIGTPRYISPEVAGQYAPTPLSDVYSLGILMYECATGVAPFVFRSATPKIQNNYIIELQKHQRPTPPSKINRHVSQGLENLIMQMIEKDPAFRPQSISEVKERLIHLDETPNQIIKPYIYRSKTFSGANDNKASSKVGTTYDLLKTRFRQKFALTFLFIFLIILVGLIVEMVVLI